MGLRMNGKSKNHRGANSEQQQNNSFHRYYDNDSDNDEDFYRDLLSTTRNNSTSKEAKRSPSRRATSLSSHLSASSSSRHSIQMSSSSSVGGDLQHNGSVTYRGAVFGGGKDDLKRPPHVHRSSSDGMAHSMFARRAASSSSFHGSSSAYSLTDEHKAMLLDDSSETHRNDRRKRKAMRGRRVRRQAGLLDVLSSFEDNTDEKNGPDKKSQSKNSLASYLFQSTPKLESSSLSTTSSSSSGVSSTNDESISTSREKTTRRDNQCLSKYIESTSCHDKKEPLSCSASWSHFDTATTTMRRHPRQQQQRTSESHFNSHGRQLGHLSSLDDSYINSLCLGQRTTSFSSSGGSTKPTKLNGSSLSLSKRDRGAESDGEGSKNRRKRNIWHTSIQYLASIDRMMFIPICLFALSVLGAIGILYNISYLSTTTSSTSFYSPNSHLRQWKGNPQRPFHFAKNKANVDSVYVSNIKHVEESLRRAHRRYDGREWPTSVRDEEESDYELIEHPADPSVTLSVPRFYVSADEDGNGSQNSKSSVTILGEGKLLTKSIAGNIGSYIYENGRLASDQNAQTIYVNIVSYRDHRCRHTVESIFDSAKYPERIRVGVVDQINRSGDTDIPCDTPIKPCESDPSQALCRYRDHIDVFEMKTSLAVGPMFARHVGHRMYRGEYFVLQATSSLLFVKDWDVDIIEQWGRAGNEMAVLSTYSTDLEEDDTDEMTGRTARFERPVLCDASFEGDGARDGMRLRHPKWRQPDVSAPGKVGVAKSPQLQPFWSSEFSFSRGHFVLAVPYDPWLPMVDQDDEEISMAVRAFTNGYDFYAPERLISFRVFSQSEDQRINIDDFDDIVNPFQEQVASFPGKQSSSLYRLYGLLGMNPEIDPSTWDHRDKELYGVGGVRKASKFFSLYGIHVKERVVEQKLCDFVTSGNMQSLFTQNLRADGMGIDYSDVHFRFHELIRIHEG